MANVAGTGLTPGVEGNGHPGDQWGYALMAGIRLNAPMIGVGDYLAAQVIYTQGALRYLYQNPGTGNMYLQDNQSTTFGLMSDGVYGGTSIASVSTRHRHPVDDGVGRQRRLRALLEPAVENISLRRLRPDELQLDSQCPHLCQPWCSATGQWLLAVASAGCNMNWNQWWVGSRTQWNVTKDFYMGLDVAYVKFESASFPGGVTRRY